MGIAAGAQETAKTWDQLVYMQDMNPSACNSQATPAASATTVPTKTLTDSRDGSTYTIAKLADGNCWMTQNLRIVSKLLTPDDSDVTGNYYLPASVALDKTPANDTPQYFSNNDTYQSRVYYNNNTTYGAHYSWFAATAGTGDAKITSGNAPSSICPKGWQLPTNNNTDANQKPFGKLTTTYSIGSNGGKLTQTPLSFFFGGYVNNSSLNYANSSGYYWSSTAIDSYNAYLLSFNISNFTPSGSLYRYDGSSVRCVAR